MPPNIRTGEKELRCSVCSMNPLLATYGVNHRGELYVHIKVWKGKRIFNESYITPEGSCKIRLLCRDCFRWHRIKITQPGRAVLEVVEDADGEYSPSAS